MTRQLVFLGTSSGVPTPIRNVSSCGVQLENGELFLIDAGEGTQQQLQVRPMMQMVIDLGLF